MGERLGKRCINRIELIVSFAVPAFAKDPAAPETCLTGAPGSKANAGTARDTIYMCRVRGSFLGMGFPVGWVPPRDSGPEARMNPWCLGPGL